VKTPEPFSTGSTDTTREQPLISGSFEYFLGEVHDFFFYSQYDADVIGCAAEITPFINLNLNRFLGAAHLMLFGFVFI
jgi:hypothetical protein